MKYYRVTADMIYYGEPLTDYIATDSEETLIAFKQKLMEDCAADWEPFWSDYADEGYESEEEWQEVYFSNCSATAEEITEAEYKEITSMWPFTLVKERY
jgi:hypothetical protein